MQTELQTLAQQHLWPHYTEMSGLRDGTLPIIVRGEGCTVEDSFGRRFLDGLAGLFCVQIGYSHGAEIGEAAAAQLSELPYYPNWSYAHPRAIELAAEVARSQEGRTDGDVLGTATKRRRVSTVCGQVLTSQQILSTLDAPACKCS